MKRTGRNLRRRLSEMTRFADRLVRARHFRGHGVHSPFVYALVRETFMKRGLRTSERALYEALLEAGVAKRRAVQLQNLFSHCGYRTFGLNCAAEVDMNVLTRDFPAERLPEMLGRASERGTTLCVMSPYDDALRIEECRRLVREHASTSVDNRGYLLLFNNYLPKQHFRL